MSLVLVVLPFWKMESSEAHTDGLVNEAAALLKAALEPRAPAEADNYHGLVSLYS